MREIGRSTPKSSLKEYYFNTGLNKFPWMKVQRTSSQGIMSDSQQKQLRVVLDPLGLYLLKLSV